MNIIQCSFCKKPFHSIGSKVCTDCLKKMDEDFIKVRDYIYEHKNTDMDVVSEETGVSKQVILHLLKEGRLILDDKHGGGGMLLCEICKKPINTGRMCDKCKGSLASTMEKSISASKPQQPQRSSAVDHISSAKIKK